MRNGPFGIEVGVELVDRQDVAQISLVVLEHDGEFRNLEAELLEVFDEAIEALDIRVPHRALRIGHKHQPVDALEHQFAGRIIEDLAGYRVQLESGFETADRPNFNRQQIEKQGPVGFGLERHHFAARFGRGLGIDVAEI
jgi:hypothetical protein